MRSLVTENDAPIVINGKGEVVSGPEIEPIVFDSGWTLKISVMTETFNLPLKENSGPDELIDECTSWIKANLVQDSEDEDDKYIIYEILINDIKKEVMIDIEELDETSEIEFEPETIIQKLISYE